MTVNTSTARVSQNGDGVTASFPVPFYFLQNSDLAVYADGALKLLTTDYAVSGAGNPAGGAVNFVLPPAAGTGNVVIVRDPDQLQAIKYPANDPFPAKTHETALDKLTMLVQRTRDLIGRAFTLADADASGASLTVPAPQAGYLIGWNQGGTGLANFANTGGGSTLSLPISLVNGGLGISHASVAAARVTLGLGTAALANTGIAAGHVLVLDGAAKIPAVDGSQITNIPAGPLPRGYRYGLALSYMSASIFGVSTGIARSSTDAVNLALGSAFTGIVQSSGNWSAGSGANKLDTGARGNNTTYYVFICSGSSGTDIICSLSRTAPSLPAGYNASFRRVRGYLRTDGSGNIRPFDQGNEQEFNFRDQIQDVSAFSIGQTPQLQTFASVAPGFIGLTNILIGAGASTIVVLIYPTNQYVSISGYTAVPPNGSCLVPASTNLHFSFRVRVDASNQIKVAATNSGTLYVGVYGYIDDLPD